MSPERFTTSQEEAVSTPKMSVPASPVAGTPLREAQSPISLLLAVAHSHCRNGDDDLTSLSWLHEQDLLKGMNINPSPLNSSSSTPVKYSNNLLTDQLPASDYVDDSSYSAADSSSSSLNSPISVSYHQPQQNQQQQQQLQNGTTQRKHPHNLPYDPLIHTNNKPPYSFSCLIFMAIEDSPQKALPVKEIYAWILEHFPYFKNAPTGWKNSVRHNLSLNKCFQKVEKAPNLGKGSLWTVDPQYKPNLIQALTRSPFHPCAVYFNNNNNNNISTNNNINNNNNTSVILEKSASSRLPNPELYPYLSKKLAAATSTTANELEIGIREENEFNNNNCVKSENESEIDESLDAADAAAVMLSLKNGSKYRTKRDRKMWQIITTSPSQDHTYSAIDETVEIDKDRIKMVTCRKLNFEDEEERKTKEGAETLLNLAGIATTTKKHDECIKRIKLSLEYDRNDNDGDIEKHTPFKPRLLRTKKKEGNKSKNLLNFNNNNINNNNHNNNNNDEWIKHRRELEINIQHR